MGAGFVVHPEALLGYAQLLETQAERMQQVNAAISGVSVSADAFGQLPNSSSMHGQYTAHAEAETQNTKDMAEILSGIGHALAAVAGEYQAVEEEHVHALGSIAANRAAN